MDLEDVKRVFAALKRERLLHGIHLAGGEAALRFDYPSGP